jgi:hypothetical protein
VALHFPLMVNGKQIGGLIAQRREAAIPADRICTYDVQVELNGVCRTAVVWHNYDAGAMALVMTALAAVPSLTSTGQAMPVFTIKAQDKLAIRAVEAYRRLCVDAGLDEQVLQVDLAIGEMLHWRGANPDRVRLPEHRHIPPDGR